MNPTPPQPATPTPEALHLRSVLIAALALLAVLWLHLISALLAGLGGFVLYRWARATARTGSGSLGSRLLTIASVSVLLLIVGAALFGGFELLLSGSADGLAKLLQLMADTLDQIRATAPDWMTS
ncbi:MAG: hypothetical protein JWP43_3394, partial [Ramlibacter sp.]|nr:hypothetical protein [Ramlibacter sp.]